MGSPFVASLMREAIADYLAGGLVQPVLDAHPGYPRPGLHLAGALHYLALAGEPTLTPHYPSTGGDGDAVAAWAAARRLIDEQPQRFERLFMRPIQTNESARSLPLLGAFAWLAAHHHMPLRLFEIGASAGLNLRFDRFGYRGETWQWGDLAAPLVLENRVKSGAPRHLDATIEVAQRKGCDPDPLDAARKEDRLHLQSFIWPDQIERLQRLRRALDIAKTLPVQLDAEGFVTWLPRVATTEPNHVTVVFHTIVEEHFSPSTRAELKALIAAFASTAAPRAPVAYVRMELDDRTYRTEVTSWPKPGEPVSICTSDGHGQDIVWS